MKVLRAKQLSSALLIFVCMLGNGLAQPSPGAPHAAAAAVLPAHAGSSAPARAFPGLHLSSSLELTYIGMFSPDAVYRKAQTFDGRVAGEGILPAASGRVRASFGEAPPWMLLASERVVENVEPPTHAKATHSVPAPPVAMRNHFVTYIYGRPSVLYAPLHITTDSHQRLIISDPKASAVHVLDRNGKSSLRLTTGTGYRLHQPAGVAVDAADNIYVADPQHGMIVVFDASGNFVRYLGNRAGEPEYERPQGLAIDLKNQHLFLIDTPRNLVFELDLAGRELKRAGKSRDGSGTVEFDGPTDVTINHDRVFVLDRSGTRVQVFDLNLDPETKFDLPRGQDPRVDRENKLCADADGNVYVSSNRNSVIRVYTPGGQLLASFGKSGTRVGEFAAPAGLWVDSANRLYVADSGNGRVQLFQLTVSSHSASHTAAVP